MMELPHREFFTGEPLDAFLHGVEIALTKKRMKKIALLRLSAKTDSHGRQQLISIWGREGRTPAGIYTQGPVNTSKFTKEDWFQMGKLIGVSMENWVDNDQEFDRAEGKANGVQFDVWKTDETWDRAQDLIDVLEHDFQQHINSKLHWRVRKALTELIQMLMTDAHTAIAAHLAQPEGRDVLNAIAKLAGFALDPLPSAPAASAVPTKKLVAKEAV